MALVWLDRVMETTTTTGTGSLTLAGAVTGYQTFAAVGNGNTCYYCLFAVDANGVPTGVWESGLGTWATGGTLARTTVHANSSGGASALSLAAGTKRVILTPTAAHYGTLLASANNLSDLSSAATARTNLGLGALATASTVALASQVSGTLPVASGGTGLTALGSALQVLRTNAGGTAAEWATISSVSAADPTGTVGLTAVNGSASTFLRSDGAPALSQSITPTWTGLHTFQAQTSAKAAVFRAAASSPDNVIEVQTSGGSIRLSVSPLGVITGKCDEYPAFILTSVSGNPYFMVYPNGSVYVYGPLDVQFDGPAARSVGGSGLGFTSYSPWAYNGQTGNPAFTLDAANGQTATLIRTRGYSSTTLREMLDLDAVWATSTDATRKARGVYRVWDTAAREAWRAESDGSRGYLIQSAHATAPDDSMLPNSSVAFYDDGSGSLKIKLKDSGGTVRTGTVTLT